MVIAVSGGLDSMVLLHVMHTLAAHEGWRLAVAHFNHRLRGQSSVADERLVQRTAKRLGLPFYRDEASVRQIAQAQGISLEMAGRRLRHEFLARTALASGARKVALAHHADDQVELFFLRLLRGAGTTGLKGMRFQSPSSANPRVQLIRPLLQANRAELEQFAAEQGVAYRQDASNADLDFLRNRVRHELLPLLKKSYQPALEAVIRRTLDVLDAEWVFVADSAKAAVREKKRFEELPLALQRRLLLAECHALGLEPNFQLIEQLRGEAGRKIMVRPGLKVWREKTGSVRSEADPPRRVESPEQPATAVVLEGDHGRLRVERVLFSWKIKKWAGQTELLRATGARMERFDADRVGGRIGLRHWRPGDRFQPIGMTTPVKLQDLFTNAKIPRGRRAELWLAEAETGEIFWVEELRIGEKFKVRAETGRYLEWTWKRRARGIEAVDRHGSKWE